MLGTQQASRAVCPLPLRLNGRRSASGATRAARIATTSELKLLIGNKNYSSWSLRPWLFLKAHKIPFEEQKIKLHQPTTHDQVLAAGSPTGKLPALLENGHLIAWDSLAILEYLAERYPEKHGWPMDRKERARARSLAAEMHSGFFGIRSEFPMNVKRSAARKTWPSKVDEEVARVVEIWARERRNATPEAGPFLFGDFGAVDCMFAPVVLRFHSYKIPVEDPLVRMYMDSVLSLPALKEWVRDAKEEAKEEGWAIEKADMVD